MQDTQSTKNTRRIKTIDAAGRSLGRVATEVARLLQGKHRPSWSPHIDSGEAVLVTNLDQAKFTGAKFTDKQYHRHTGYPGGLRTENLSDRWERSPIETFRSIVRRMLPDTKLRRAQIARLKASR